jgi:hypothetical protein
MIDELTRTDLNFCVVCIWCGAKIRDDAEEDAWGVCLKCFYRMNVSVSGENLIGGCLDSRAPWNS